MIGQTIQNKYSVLREVGPGPMYIAYLAVNDVTNEIVLLLVVKLQHDRGKQFLSRFVRDARRLESLNSPYIPRLLEYGLSEGIPFIVYEYFPVRQLRDVLQEEGVMEMRRCLHIIGQIIQCLVDVNAAGIGHQALCPANVLLTPDDGVRLMGFGLYTPDNLRGLALGSDGNIAPYLPPELMDGRTLDNRGQVYSLGAMMHKILGGDMSRHDTGDDEETGPTTRANTSRFRLNDVNATVPEAVERVVLKAVARHPADRYQSLSMLSEALYKSVRDVAPGTRVLPRPAGYRSAVPANAKMKRSRPAKGRRSRSRSPVAALVVALLALALLICVGAGLVSQRGSDPDTPVISLATTSAPAGTATPTYVSVASTVRLATSSPTEREVLVTRLAPTAEVSPTTDVPARGQDSSEPSILEPTPALVPVKYGTRKPALHKDKSTASFVPDEPESDLVHPTSTRFPVVTRAPSPMRVTFVLAPGKPSTPTSRASRARAQTEPRAETVPDSESQVTSRPAPTLLSLGPSHRTSDGWVDFAWSESEQLAPEECFELVMSGEESGPYWGAVACTKSREVKLNVVEARHIKAGLGGEYYWTVRVNKLGASGRWETVSAMPEPREVKLSPSGDSGSGDEGKFNPKPDPGL